VNDTDLQTLAGKSGVQESHLKEIRLSW